MNHLVRRREKRNEWFDKECRMAIQEKNMGKIMLQRMTRSSKPNYRYGRGRAILLTKYCAVVKWRQMRWAGHVACMGG
jgi:hypothetical protein